VRRGNTAGGYTLSAGEPPPDRGNRGRGKDKKCAQGGARKPRVLTTWGRPGQVEAELGDTQTPGFPDIGMNVAPGSGRRERNPTGGTVAGEGKRCRPGDSNGSILESHLETPALEKKETKKKKKKKKFRPNGHRSTLLGCKTFEEEGCGKGTVYLRVCSTKNHKSVTTKAHARDVT